MRPHFTIRATNPRHVATVLVELGNGAVINGGLHHDCFIAWLGDKDGTVIEVFPLEPTVFGNDVQGQASSEGNSVSSSLNAIYGPLSIKRSADDVYAIVQREGWRAPVASHSSGEVIELWIENQVILELIILDNNDVAREGKPSA